jgi:cytidylate kinase
MTQNVVTLDGPSGVGKTAVAPALAERFGWRWCSVGQVFRALALIRSAGLGALEELVVEVDGSGPAPHPRFEIGGRTLDDLYSSEVEALAAELARQEDVRALARRQVLAFVGDGYAVVEGRTGSSLFPDALLRVHLWASPEERLRRRRQTFGESAASAIERDRADGERTLDPLRVCDGMMLWDSTHCTPDETIEGIARRVGDAEGSKPLSATVVVSVRNGAEHLPPVLAALRSQLAPSGYHAGLVLHASSDDDSAALALAHGVGRSAARETALEQLDTDVAIFLDGDMLVQEDFVDAHVALHRIGNRIVVHGVRRRLPAGATSIDAYAGHRDSREALLDRLGYNLAALRLPWSLADGSNLSAPADLLRLAPRSSVTDDDRCGIEDLELAWELAQRGSRPAFSTLAAGYHVGSDPVAAPERLGAWEAHLERLVAKAPEAALLRELEPAVPAGAAGNFLEVYERLNGRAARHLRVETAAPDEDLSAAVHRGLEGIGDDTELVIVDRAGRVGGDLLLQAAAPDAGVVLFPGSRWGRLHATFRRRFEVVAA